MAESMFGKGESFKAVVVKVPTIMTTTTTTTTHSTTTTKTTTLPKTTTKTTTTTQPPKTTTTPPPMPTPNPPSITAKNVPCVRVKWVSDAALFYRVERRERTAGGSWTSWKFVSDWFAGDRLYDTSVVNDRRYKYRVYARNVSGTISAPSNVQEIVA